MNRLAALVTRLIDEARDAIEAGEVGVATDRLLDALEIDPDNAAARRLLDDHRSLKRQRTGEKKQLTIVFTDQVGSTAFVAKHGAEATTRVFRRYHELFGRAVESHGGLINSFQGDGLVACFGHPIAYGNDAARAVDASLAMLASLEPLERMVRTELDDDFGIRIGIHTGDVVIAELGTAASPLPHAITGVTPNVTSRLQDLAATNEIIVSEVTAGLLPPEYILEDNGAHQLKGIAEPMATFLVRGVDQERPNPRFLLSPHVGRTAEITALEDQWQLACSGDRGRSCLVAGEPGLGKSRLLASHRDRVQADGGLAFVAKGNDQEQAQPLRYLTRALSLGLGADGGELDARGTDVYTAADAAMVNALSVPLTSSLANEVDAGMLRQKALVGCESWIAERARHRPICLLFDDFQWADPSTRAWVIDYATRLPPQVQLVTASREIEMSLTVDAALELFPLDELAATTLVANLSGNSHPDRIKEIVDNADGVPLFLEELAQARSEKIPATLRELVQAELEPESLRFFAQMMATIGRTIPPETLGLVASAFGYDEDEVQAELGRLFDKALIEQTATMDYGFRHHLVWRAAYESQLDQVRSERHGSIADALAQVAAPDDSPFADLIGRNYLQAARPAEACTFLLAGAAQNQLIGAHAEALEQLSLVNTAVESLPPETAPVFDVGLRMRRATSTIATRGYADPEVSADFAAAAATCRALVAVPELAPILRSAVLGLWAYYTVAGDCVAGAPLIEDLRTLQASRAVVDMADGMDSFFRGELDDAADRFDMIEAGLDASETPPGWALPNDPGVCGLAVAGAVAILRNDPRADGFVERALTRADGIPFPMGPVSAALTHTYVAMAHGLARQHDLQAEHGALAKALGERHGLIEWSTLGMIHTLSGRALSGEVGLRDELAVAVASWRAMGAGACVPALLAFQAELELETGNHARAEALVSEATAFAQQTGQGLGADLLLELDQRLTESRKAAP